MVQPEYVKRFEESALWVSRMLPHVDFEAGEMAYKRAYADELSQVRNAVLAGNDDWKAMFVASFKKSNLLDWRYGDELIRMTRESPDRVAAMLKLLWHGGLTATAFNAFVLELRQFSEVFSTGVGTAIASVMLMARSPEDYPPFRAEAVGRFWKTVRWPRPDENANPHEIYASFRKSLSTFQQAATSRSLVVPDLLTAQGFMWLIVEWDPRTLLPAGQIETFRAWRGDSYTGAEQEDDRLAEVRAGIFRSLSEDAEGYFSSDFLLNFEVEGEFVPLIDASKGASIPAGFEAPVSLVMPSARTPLFPAGTVGDFVQYPRKSKLLKHPRDRALLASIAKRIPLVLLVPDREGLYEALFPVFVNRYVGKDKAFELDLNAIDTTLAGATAPEYVRAWTTGSVRQRVHQRAFRRDVLWAYGGRCAVCGLGVKQLVDAAHIIPDRDELGIASAVNGLALCKTHHAAFDAGLLGLREDLTIGIADEIMSADSDDASHVMLRRFHDQKLHVIPSAPGYGPSAESLRSSWMNFQARGSQ